MWKYWDWNEISRKFVKHYSRLIFLFLSLFLIYSITTKPLFNVLNVYNFTSKRPELIEVYSSIIIFALPHLQEAFMLSLITVPVLIILTWIPDTKNLIISSILYNFSLVLFGLLSLAYMCGVIFILKSTCWGFLYLFIVILLVITTLFINHLYYKKNKEKFDNEHTNIDKKLLIFVIVSILGLEIFIAFPRLMDSKKSLNTYYETVCNNLYHDSYRQYFSLITDKESKYYKDVRDELQISSESYILLQFINLYSSEEYNFTPEEIIECYNALENTDLKTSSDSWNGLLILFDANKSAYENSQHLEKYNMKYSLLSNGYTAKHSFYENVIRRLVELGYKDYNNLQIIDKAVIDEACLYVYNAFESGLYEPIKEVNLNISHSGGEYIISADENKQYFVYLYNVNKYDENIIHIHLHHTVGYYFDENTVINIKGLENYVISDKELIFQPEHNRQLPDYADFDFDIILME
ncbi:MAG: hypothetical protein IKJ73_01750 [Lachnospiraceae bacterium]|nr:hypothetical protein [Lachnospiraceae bacterium]